MILERGKDENNNFKEMIDYASGIENEVQWESRFMSE